MKIKSIEMETRKIANLENPARRPCALGHGAIGYIIDDGFCVLDYFRMEEHLTHVRGATPLGAVSGDICSGNALALAFFANENELYVYPLFLACDSPFENAETEDGFVIPKNAVRLEGNPLEFQPKHLTSSLSRGEILFKASGLLGDKLVVISGAINHDPEQACDFIRYSEIEYTDIAGDLVYDTPFGVKIAPASVNTFDFGGKRFKRQGVRQVCVCPDGQGFIVSDCCLAKVFGGKASEKHTPFVGRNRQVLCQTSKTFLVTETALYAVTQALEFELVATIPNGAECVLFATGSERGPDEAMIAIVSGTSVEFLPMEPRPSNARGR